MKKVFLYLFLLFAATAMLRTYPLMAQQEITDNVYHLTDEGFDDFIKKGVVLVDFWAVWCGPCKIQSPIVDQIASEIGQKARIAKMDVDKHAITARKYYIRYLPTVMIFRNGKPVETFQGVTDKETLMTAIEKHNY